MLLRYALSEDKAEIKPLAYCNSLEKAIELTSNQIYLHSVLKLFVWVGPTEEVGEWALVATYNPYLDDWDHSPEKAEQAMNRMLGEETSSTSAISFLMTLINKVRTLEERIEELEALEGPPGK